MLLVDGDAVGWREDINYISCVYVCLFSLINENKDNILIDDNILSNNKTKKLSKGVKARFFFYENPVETTVQTVLSVAMGYDID